jgi:hypothetical protein
MSVLRFSSPGLSTEFRDLGPSVGRTSHTRLQGGNRTLIAGELVSGESGNATQQRHAEMKRSRRRRERTRQDVIDQHLSGKVEQDRPRRPILEGEPRCDLWLPIAHEWCGRRPGHTGKHRSRDVLIREAARRRLERAS